MTRHGLRESLRASVPRRHMRVYEPSYIAERVGPAGPSLFVRPRNTESGCIRFDSCQEWCSDQTCRIEGIRKNRKRAERRGAMLEKMMSKVIKDTHASGRESMDMTFSECLNAVNEMTRRGGFLLQYSGYSRVFHATWPRGISRCGCFASMC